MTEDRENKSYYDAKWGIYTKKNPVNIPSFRYDPFYSRIDPETDKKISHVTQISPIRSKQPFEMHEPEGFIDSFCRIAKGKLPAIVITNDDQIHQSPLSIHEEKRDWSDNTAISFINLFSPMARISIAPEENKEEVLQGIALVHTVVEHCDFVSDLNISQLQKLLTNTQLAQKETIRVLKETNKVEKLRMMHFFNMGIESGASIPHLHSQTYIYTADIGIGLYSEIQSQIQSQSTANCIGCQMANNKVKKDSFNQSLNIDERTVFDNGNWRVVTAFAPIREGHLRLMPKKHMGNFVDLGTNQLQDLAEAMFIADKAINVFIKQPNRKYLAKINRNILFKQSHVGFTDNIHMFIDFIINHPVGGAELLDAFRVTHIEPEKIAQIMRKGIETKTS